MLYRSWDRSVSKCCRQPTGRELGNQIVRYDFDIGPVGRRKSSGGRSLKLAYRCSQGAALRQQADVAERRLASGLNLDLSDGTYTVWLDGLSDS